jgi:hypothetical protein
MKSEKIITAIGLIDDKIIDEADTDMLKVKPKKILWLLPAIAACIVVVVIWATNPFSPTSDKYAGLPKLTVNTERGTFGYEGLLAYDISELLNGNPWSESDGITVLPVYNNPTTYDGAGTPINGLSADEMTIMAEEMAAILGFSVDSIYTEPTEEYLAAKRAKLNEMTIQERESEPIVTTPTRAIAICGSIRIEVEANGLLTILFEPGVSLPSEYAFPVREDYYISEAITIDPATGETNTERDERLPDENFRVNYKAEMEKAANTLVYLLSAYEPILDMESPELKLFGDYNLFGQLHIQYEAYEGHINMVDRILGYNFNHVTFAPNEEGALWIIRRYKEDLSQKIGDYPIISAAEARTLLLKNRYIT